MDFCVVGFGCVNCWSVGAMRMFRLICAALGSFCGRETVSRGWW
jgi:hypothetical protein